MKNEDDSDKVYKLGGWSAILCFIIAILGLLFAFLSIPEDMDMSGAGLCLIAPAIAMGLLAQGFMRR